MVQEINLIPPEELQLQYKDKAVKFSTILAIIMLIGVASFSGYLYYQKTETQKQLTALDSDVESLRKEIQGMSNVEVKIRNLDKKYTALQGIFGKQLKYSKLMKELKARKPEGIEVSNIDIRPGVINISGLGNSFISISDYVNNLLNTKFEGGVQGLEGVFTQVTLNSISLENTTNKDQFFIVVNYDSGKLK